MFEKGLFLVPSLKSICFHLHFLSPVVICSCFVTEKCCLGLQNHSSHLSVFVSWANPTDSLQVRVRCKHSKTCASFTDGFSSSAGIWFFAENVLVCGFLSTLARVQNTRKENHFHRLGSWWRFKRRGISSRLIRAVFWFLGRHREETKKNMSLCWWVLKMFH